jgi:hypothetical protein
MLQALLAEDVVAGEADGLVEGALADQAHQVAVTLGDILQNAYVDRRIDAEALPTLRRW